VDRLRSVRVERVGNPARLLRRHAAEAIVPPGDILAFVAWGMDRELREVFGLVRSNRRRSPRRRATRTPTIGHTEGPNADAPGGEPGAFMFLLASRSTHARGLPAGRWPNPTFPRRP
jgi:hypothetical protein